MIRFWGYLLLIFIISLNPFNGIAQSFNAGITAGLNTARVLGGVNHSGWRRFGIIAGPFVEYELNELSGLKMEMLFSQKGEKKPYRPNVGDYTFYQLRLNYIDIPVFYYYKHTKFIFEAGPSFNYLIEYSEEDLSGPLTFERPFNTMEFAALFGVNYKLTENLDMNWRYSNSLVPIREHLGGSVYRLNRGQYNSFFTFKVIYWFNKDRKHASGE
ncbi:MAG: PorT family protein [Bacteroidetes bacterium]|nr:PorT family protein [Bacteroidota bacterium]HET6243224.1 porin family protein [Bacteroidia bacterium]